MFCSVYDDPCEFVTHIHVACPQAVIDLGLTCRCPINPVHLVMNYHSRRSDILSSTFGSFLSGFYSIFVGMTNILYGRFKVKEISSLYGFLATVSIYDIASASFCSPNRSKLYVHEV